MTQSAMGESSKLHAKHFIWTTKFCSTDRCSVKIEADTPLQRARGDLFQASEVPIQAKLAQRFGAPQAHVSRLGPYIAH